MITATSGVTAVDIFLCYSSEELALARGNHVD